MPDKDQFTFDDDDDFPETDLGDQEESLEPDVNDDDEFPETDLSDAFSEGEHEAEVPVQDEPEPNLKGGGNSRMRILLMVLLLLVAGGGGAYYFMGLGGTTPSVPTVQVPAKKATKSVALPAPPSKAPDAPAKAKSAAKPVTVAVPPPAKPVPAKQPAIMEKAKPAAVAKVAEKPKPTPVKQPATKVAVPAPKPAPAQQTQAVAAKPAPVPQKATVTESAPKPAELPKPVAAASKVVGGAFALDAGSYLFDSNKKTLVAKIKKLGYEPLVTPVDATLDMTRLRLGTFDKDEIQEALDFARTIEPGSYSAPAGDRYVLYAGTFLKSRNVEKMTQLFLKEGINVHSEPVQVVRTLSRIRFGSFATKEDAAVAAREVSEAGLKAAVVRFK